MSDDDVRPTANNDGERGRDGHDGRRESGGEPLVEGDLSSLKERDGIGEEARKEEAENESATKKESARDVEANANQSGSFTEAQINVLLAKIHSSQEGRTMNPCSDCGRLHHPSRMPWTQSHACNPVAGRGVVEDEFLDAEEGDGAEPNFAPFPLIFDNTEVNQLLMTAMNLVISVIIGGYFDNLFLHLIHTHHKDLFPPPISAQLTHFLIVVLLAFWSLQRLCRTVLMRMA